MAFPIHGLPALFMLYGDCYCHSHFGSIHEPTPVGVSCRSFEVCVGFLKKVPLSTEGLGDDLARPSNDLVNQLRAKGRAPARAKALEFPSAQFVLQEPCGLMLACLSEGTFPGYQPQLYHNY